MECERMRIIVVGLGSMGKRRIRLLKELGEKEIVGVDTNDERRSNVEKELCVSTSGDLFGLLNSKEYDCAFICTSPASHGKLINSCLLAGLHVFTEINLVDDMYEENMKIASEKDLTLFLSSTFLYREEIKWLINRVRSSELQYDYIYHVGQYLPDWHPWESYKNFFVADQRTNACREIFAIELPWIITCFGDISDVCCINGNLTKLDLPFPDNYLIQVTHNNGNKGLLAVDVVARKSVRRLELYNERDYLVWDGGKSSISYFDVEKKIDEEISFGAVHINKYASFINEVPYLEEIKAFLNAISKNENPKWSFRRDLEMLHIIDKLEKK